MRQPKIEKLGVRIVVAERQGMRRFLYPLRVKLPALYRRLVSSLALAELDGTPIPSHVEIDNTDAGLWCLFAISLAPQEIRELNLVRIDPERGGAPVPDPLQISESEDGFVSRQERVEFEIGGMAQLGSVVYDGEQHLAGPVAVTLDGHVAEPAAGYRPTLSDALRGGLGARFSCEGIYADSPAARAASRTEVELTACKSWVWLRHTLSSAQAGSLLRFTIPLTVTSPVQTCDFGVGNGAYGKIQPELIDEIACELDLGAGRAASYRILSHLSKTQEARIDYAGVIKGGSEPASRLWLHWIEPSKSIAVAVTQYPKECAGMVFRMSDRGVVAVEFEIGETTASPLAFGVCCHFLNGLPAVAAATNAASILSPPLASVVRSDT